MTLIYLAAAAVILAAFGLGWWSCRAATYRRIIRRIDAAERRIAERQPRAPPP